MSNKHEELDSSAIDQEVVLAVKGKDAQWSKKKFWQKLLHYSKKAGKEVLEKALLLYYVAQSDHVPKSVKALIFGALGYFMSTLDGIPDITPMIGFVDDLGIMAAVLALVASKINPDIQQKVDEKLARFFENEASSSDSSNPDASSSETK